MDGGQGPQWGRSLLPEVGALPPRTVPCGSRKARSAPAGRMTSKQLPASLQRVLRGCAPPNAPPAPCPLHWPLRGFQVSVPSREELGREQGGAVQGEPVSGVLQQMALGHCPLACPPCELRVREVPCPLSTAAEKRTPDLCIHFLLKSRSMVGQRAREALGARSPLRE